MLGIIMAGGQGSRLMPLTATRPKPMVHVLGRPVIDYVKDAMVEAGIEEIVVTTGYRGEQLQSHVESWTNAALPLMAWVNQESSPMGTAGSVGLLRERINSTCVVGSGDAVASFDIASLLAAHRQNKAKVTMALWQVDNPSEFGIVGLSTTEDGEVDGDVCAIEDRKTEGHQLQEVGDISQLPAVDPIAQRSSKQAGQGQA